MDYTNKPNQLLVKSRNIIILLLYFILFYFIPPIIFGLFFAYLLFPVFIFFKEQFKLPFFLVVIILSVLIFAVVVSIILLLIHSFITLLPVIQSTLLSLEDNYIKHPLLPFIIEKLQNFLNEFLFLIVTMLKNSFQSLFEFFIFVVTFYFALFESYKNRLWFFAYIPKAYRDAWSRYFQKGMELIGSFIVVELQLFTITFLLLCGSFYFLNFESFIIKAFLIAVADCLPFLGIGIFLIPVAIYYFIISNPLMGATIIGIYFIVQTIRQLTESMLWSHTLHLRMIHTFLISAASVLLFGFYGIIVSPILLMVAIKLKQHPTFAR
ncbi:AI-2E family transporter [Solibacillus sp. FSL K6-4121]|uniref:AI-2E family transporter n=1 Tax=Solibacillus sp. FSL K6-4121 TaxID=2921505 RepID=UPI0030FB1975